MKRFVMSFSGGLCSWFAARRLVDRYGPSRVILLFADTLMEHDDLYRFLDDAGPTWAFPSQGLPMVARHGIFSSRTA